MSIDLDDLSLVASTVDWTADIERAEAARILDEARQLREESRNLRLLARHMKTQARRQARALRLASRAAIRLIDITCAAMGLLITLPLWAICVVLVRLTSPGPALFRQTRIGRHGEPFTIWKFRTMYADADDRSHREQTLLEMQGGGRLDAGTAYKDDRDPRITPIGRILRKLSLDEIPQLFNVLHGDMAIVGPRPSLPYEVALFPTWARDRFRVRPGLTGLWQVSGRADLPLPEMLGLDCFYVHHRSVVRDLLIMARTPVAMVQGAA